MQSEWIDDDNQNNKRTEFLFFFSNFQISVINETDWQKLRMRLISIGWSNWPIFFFFFRWKRTKHTGETYRFIDDDGNKTSNKKTKQNKNGVTVKFMPWKDARNESNNGRYHSRLESLTFKSLIRCDRTDGTTIKTQRDIEFVLFVLFFAFLIIVK